MLLATLVDLSSPMICAKIQPQGILEKIFKCFYHIWAWRPSWSTDRNNFINLLFPFLKAAPFEIWAKLAQRLQRSRLKFSTIFAFKCMGLIQMHREANLTLPQKSQMSTYDNSFSNFGRPPVPDDSCKDSTPRHPRFWRRRFLKVFTIYGHGSDLDHFSNLSFPHPKGALYEIWTKLAQ